MLHPELRDGNVPAGSGQLRVVKERPDKAPGPGIEKASLRSGSVGGGEDLPPCCGEGRDARFGVIAVATPVDMTAAFREAACEADRHPLTRRHADGREIGTGREGAGACHAPTGPGVAGSPRIIDFR